MKALSQNEGYTTRMAGDMRSFFSIASFDDSLESWCVFIPKGQAIVKYKPARNEFFFHKITLDNVEEFLLKKCNIVKNMCSVLAQQPTAKATNAAFQQEMTWHNGSLLQERKQPILNKLIVACLDSTSILKWERVRSPKTYRTSLRLNDITSHGIMRTYCCENITF